MDVPGAHGLRSPPCSGAKSPHRLRERRVDTALDFAFARRRVLINGTRETLFLERARATGPFRYFSPAVFVGALRGRGAALPPGAGASRRAGGGVAKARISGATGSGFSTFGEWPAPGIRCGLRRRAPAGRRRSPPARRRSGPRRRRSPAAARATAASRSSSGLCVDVVLLGVGRVLERRVGHRAQVVDGLVGVVEAARDVVARARTPGRTGPGSSTAGAICTSRSIACPITGAHS